MANAVTPVILGLLFLGPRSGYEIKATVDRSTRFFWAASYGQIYPELRRLEREGLIEGEDAPNGSRPRRIYRLTAAGRGELDAWLRRQGPLMIEHRDELLLRMFFADALPHDEALILLETRKRIFEEVLETLHAIDERPGEDPRFVELVLRWGIAYTEWETRWCAEQLERLQDAPTTAS
jgi:PadR family transcriptional regulator, regulatory protein AphA